MSIPNPYPNIADKEINDAKTWSSAKIINELQPALDTEITCEETYEGNIITFNNLTNKEITSLECKIIPIQEGTGDPSPSNPRPISGTSVLNVTRTGKNLFDPSTEFSEFYVYATAKNVLPSVTCTMSFTDNDTTQDISGVYFGFVSSNYTGGAPTVYRWGVQNGAVVGNITNLSPSGNMTGLFYYPNNPATLEKILNRFNVQIELGTTATTYEPYKGTTYTIDLGQEILGGSADCVGGTGSKTKVKIDLGSLEWTYHPASGQYSDFFDCQLPSDSITGTSGVAFDGLCSIYKSIPSANITTSGYDNNVMALAQGTRRFIVCDQRFHTKEDFESAMSGIYLTYPLATPTEYTFTGQPIDSLLGVNNVWTDADDIKVTTSEAETIENILKERGILP